MCFSATDAVLAHPAERNQQRVPKTEHSAEGTQNSAPSRGYPTQRTQQSAISTAHPAEGTQHRALSTATSLRAGSPICSRCNRPFSTRPDRLRGPPRLFCGDRSIFLRRQSYRGAKVTTSPQSGTHTKTRISYTSNSPYAFTACTGTTLYVNRPSQYNTL